MDTPKITTLLDNEGYTEDCYECPYLQIVYDKEPYGETWATRETWECLATDDRDCQRLE